MDSLSSWFPTLSPVTGVLGAVGGGISTAFGGWDAGVTTLVVVMAVDFITGVLVAAVFQKSQKTPNGALESKAGWKGLCRKIMTLLLVLVAAQMDEMLGCQWIRDAVLIAFLINELVSVLENAALMGVPVPAALAKALEVLHVRIKNQTNEQDNTQ